jgi:hypothetical protein
MNAGAKSKHKNTCCRYVGEIIDEEECQARLTKQEVAGTESFYILALDGGA